MALKKVPLRRLEDGIPNTALRCVVKMCCNLSCVTKILRKTHKTLKPYCSLMKYVDVMCVQFLLVQGNKGVAGN